VTKARIAAVVQKGGQLETGFRAAKRGPGKEAETETHYGCLQAVELVFEFELVLRGQGLTAPVYHGKQRLEEGGGAPVIGISKGGAGHQRRAPR